MATIDSSFVRQEIKRIIATGQGMAKRLKALFEKLESDPSQFDELDELDPAIADEFSNVTLRKAYLTSGKHDFRIVFAHWKDTDFEHVDLLLAFPRKRGYAIDWNWMGDILHKVDPN
jgi:hypothetical protein